MIMSEIVFFLCCLLTNLLIFRLYNSEHIKTHRYLIIAILIILVVLVGGFLSTQEDLYSAWLFSPMSLLFFLLVTLGETYELRRLKNLFDEETSKLVIGIKHHFFSWGMLGIVAIFQLLVALGAIQW